MVIVMICKFCGKNITGCLSVCKKCSEKYKNIKCTYIPNGIEYIDSILRSSANSNQDKYNSCAADMIMASKRTDKGGLSNQIVYNKKRKNQKNILLLSRIKKPLNK